MARPRYITRNPSKGTRRDGRTRPSCCRIPPSTWIYHRWVPHPPFRRPVRVRMEAEVEVVAVTRRPGATFGFTSGSRTALNTAGAGRQHERS